MDERLAGGLTDQHGAPAQEAAAFSSSAGLGVVVLAHSGVLAGDGRGKVVLALGPRAAVEQYASTGLRRFTPATITDPDALHEELTGVRLSGVAQEREEFEKDFCCLAAPVLDHDRRFLGAVGISMSRRAFDNEREHLTETLRDVVGFQRSAEIRADLDHGPQPHTTSLQGRRFQRRRP